MSYWRSIDRRICRVWSRVSFRAGASLPCWWGCRWRSSGGRRTYFLVLALAMALRQAGYRGHITTGGHFATFSCRELLRDFPELDSVCRQEAEETVVSLARALGDGRSLGAIPGLGLRDDAGAIVVTEPPALPDTPLATLP